MRKLRHQRHGRQLDHQRWDDRLRLAFGGARTLQGNITNKGTLAINASTSYNGASADLTNEGAINVAEGKQLNVSNSGSVTNGTGGKIAAGLTGNVFLEPKSTFTEGAGTTSGTKLVIVDDSALPRHRRSASTIALRRRRQHAERQPVGGPVAGNRGTVSENANTTAVC